MVMTGAEMLAYVKRVSKRTDKDTETYEAITDTVLDMKLRYAHDRFKVEAYSVSIDTLGDYKIDVPSDFGHLVGKMRCIDGTDGTVLIKKSKPEFDVLYPNPNATGVTKAMPTHFCIFGSQFLFGAVPDKTTYSYEFSYTTEAVEIVSVSTTNVPFSDRHRECLRAGSLWRLYEGLEEWELAAYWKVRYEGANPEISIGGELGKIIESDDRRDSSVSVVRYNGI